MGDRHDPSPRAAAEAGVSLRPDGIGASLIVVVVAVVIAGIAFVAGLFSWIMMATFFAILMRPFYTWLLRHRVSSALALLLIALLMLGVVAGLAALVGTSITQMVANAPTYQAQLADRLAGLRATIDTAGLPLPSRTLTDIVDPGTLVGWLVTFLQAISGLVFNLFYMLLLVLFLLIDGPGMMARMRAGLGEDHPLAVRLSLVGPKVVSYFGIRAYVNLLTGAGVGAALWLLGIDYALLWGTLLFFFSFIPYIGIFLASVPPVLLALAEFGLPRALLVIAGITVINLMLENVVMPRMVGTSLSITPTVVLVSFFFWTGLLGGSGALLSVFLTLLTIVVLDSFERTRWLAAVMTEGDAGTADAAEPVPTVPDVDGQVPA
jgi:AI-2 transport protein TqsA